MRYFLSLLLVGWLFPGRVSAQASGYIYIESQPSRPFYLRTHDSLYVSSQGNYLILAPLGNMLGDVIVGFPGQQQAALLFSIKDTSVEQGLLLRDQGDEGWRLYDWQKEELVNVRRMGRQASDLKGLVRRSDPFAMRLSQVVNDTIILYEQPAVTNQPKALVVKVEKPVSPDTPKAVPVPESGIRLLSKKSLAKSWLLLYEEKEGGLTDTIQVEIDKPVQEAKPKVKPKAKAKPRKASRAAISVSAEGPLFTKYDQVFYRSYVSRNKVRRVSAPGERPYS
jgi:hypothetical protein